MARLTRRWNFTRWGPGLAGGKFDSHAVTAKDLGQVLKVRTITLDSLCARYSLAPDLVKVDVEGAERSVLDGARKMAAGRNTRFLVEMHSNAEFSMQQNTEQVLELVP